jgi:hypothetical protein
MATDLILNEGTKVTLVIEDKSYMGTLRLRDDGQWYIALDGGGEIEVHKRD